MLTIRYDARAGTAVPDGMAEDFVLAVHAAYPNGTVSVSSAVVMTAARALVAEGRIPHDAIRFACGDDAVAPDRKGRVAARPTGLCDVIEGLMARMYRARTGGVAG